jgi:septal ring factor EnvC (AmiA/AmiB activator)
MKKLFALLVVAGMVSFVACGPKGLSKEELEKKRQDSIKTADSIAKVEAEQKRVQDSIAKVEAEAKRVADSIAEAAKNKKPIKKPSKPVVKPNTKLPGKG